MTPEQYKEMLDNLVSIPMIADRLIHEQLAYMHEHFNVLRHELDCRIYIDRESLRKLYESIYGFVVYEAYELASRGTFKGFKVYEVNTTERLLDVVVRRKE